MSFQPTEISIRFWSMVAKTEGCWLWTGSKSKGGYGTIRASGPSRSKLRANRVSWELHNGPIPAELWVLHSCDNPACVRPDHLFLGTARDNIHDMIAKGRDKFLPNLRFGNPKLTADQVAEIRARQYRRGDSRRLAQEFGISISHIKSIRRRVCWKDI